jgi:class 3 adenylate cyclase
MLRELVRPPFPEPIEEQAWKRAERIRLGLMPTLATLNLAMRLAARPEQGFNFTNYNRSMVANVLTHVIVILINVWAVRRAQTAEQHRRIAFLSCPLEQFTGLTGIWLTGSVSSAWGVIFFVIPVAVYRAYYDARLGLWALGSALVQHGGLVALEATHVLPSRALMPQSLDPLYSQVPMQLSGMFWIAVGYGIVWALAGFVSNRYRESQHALQELNASLEERVRSQVAMLERTGRLRRYLAPQIVERIMAAEIDPVAVRERRHITVMFADLRGFTEMVERVPPDVLADVLNRYFDEVAAIAFRHGGTIDKFIGDAVMVFFGAPEATGERDQAFRCVSMALEIQRRIGELAADFMRLGAGVPVAARIGIASGVATVGSFGARHRSDFTVVGAPVNRAARLEPLAPPGGILCDATTRELLVDQFGFAAKGEVKLKGFAEPVATFQISAEPSSTATNSGAA